MKLFILIVSVFFTTICYSQNPATTGYMLMKENGSISIGTEVNTAPLTVANFSTSFPAPQTGTLIHVVSDAVTNGRLSFDTYQNTNFTGSIFQGRRARGTAAIPTAAITDDILVAIGADGYGDDSFTGASIGSMNIRANGTFTNVSKPTYISFTTTPTGSITQIERLRIKSDGTLQITSLNSVGFLQTDASGNFSTSPLSLSNITTALGYTPLNAASNLSDLSNTTTARSNLGLVIGTNVLAPNGNGSSLTGLTSSQVGLGNVNNTSDASKPISTATQTALDGKQATLVSGTNIKTINSTDITGSGNVVIAGVNSTITFLPSDVINNNASANTIADVTGLSFAVSANVTYRFKFFIVYSAAATTTGSRWSINGPATTFMNYNSNYTLTATSQTLNSGVAAYNTPAAASASSLSTGNIAIIEGVIRPSAGGTVIARFASEISSSAITAVASGRSYVEYQIIN